MEILAQSNVAIDEFLESQIAEGNFPSAAYLVGAAGQTRFVNAMGNAVREPEEHSANINTIYDLASLTKPLVTGLLCAQLLDQNLIELDSPVALFLPEFETGEKRKITIRQLLTHTSGLPAWRPLYIDAKNGRDSAINVIASQKLVAEPGKRVLYSDLGFIALGLVVERVAGQRLADIARERIFTPLGLERTTFNPDSRLRNEVAASERGNAYERGMCTPEEVGGSPDAWRSAVVWCEVHDGNAHFLGGAAGHAGLFSTVSETAQIAWQFVGSQSKLLAAKTCELFREDMTIGLEEARSFAWQLAATPDSTAGPDLPSDSFGHNGFTGTCCWIDSKHERAYILLTNRTHARELPFVNINSVRRKFNSLAVSALNSLD
jgi:CubicO group peptidase (beta-lactamase class C family)